MITCYLALGSNLRSPARQLRRAVRRLQRFPKIVVTQKSALYANPAIGRRAQPHFCNQVIEIKTSMPVKILLKHCLDIEKKHQRVRKVKWGARTLDIDILIYGKHKINLPHLTIPHPRMLEREFVMRPLQDLVFVKEIFYTEPNIIKKTRGHCVHHSLTRNRSERISLCNV